MTEARGERFTLQDYFTPQEYRRLRRLPRLLAHAFALVWQAAPRELIVCIGLQLVTAVSLLVQLLLLRNLLHTLLATTAPTFSEMLPRIIALAALSALMAAAATVLTVRNRILGQLVALHATDAVIRTAVGVDLITYESPGFHNRLQRAQLAAGSRPAMMVQGLMGTAGSLLAIGGIVGALAVIKPELCLFVIIAYLPTWIASNRAGRVFYRHTVEQTERERRRQYLFELLTTKASAQEVRAFDAGDFLADRQRGIYEGLIADLRVVLRRRLRISLVGQAGTSLLTAAGLSLLVWFVTTGRISLAAAGSAASAMVVLNSRLGGLAASSSGLYENSLYLEDYTSFVAAAPLVEAARPTGRAEQDPAILRADAVSFTYPSRNTPSLVEASLDLHRGEVVALVGENGSGKTTFAKLLAGLYAPSSGTVTWDDIDLATLDPRAVRERVAVIFQDFTRYLLPARDNIAIGDYRKSDDDRAIEKAARAAGIHEALSRLEQGYETVLGPEYYGGSDLSGGQWQRIALARLFFRDAPIVILDEPTAALDPRAEAELYESIRGLFAGRGVLIISHRFGSVRTADRIYVLRDGSVHEHGSHTDLMAADGYYADLFRLQASLYQ
jgi:ATP-binding cassette subfamily B protein